MSEWLVGLIALAVLVALAVGLWLFALPPLRPRPGVWWLPSERIALWWRRKKGDPPL